jgi:hypothetical protein
MNFLTVANFRDGRSGDDYQVCLVLRESDLASFDVQLYIGS